MTLRPLYLRREPTTDAVLAKRSPETRRTDVVVYRDAEATEPLARIPWHFAGPPSKLRPRLNINGLMRTGVWLNPLTAKGIVVKECEKARQWRESLGLSRREIAEKAGYSESQVMDLEHGSDRKTGAAISPRVWKRYRMICAAIDSGAAEVFNWKGKGE